MGLQRSSLQLVGEHCCVLELQQPLGWYANHLVDCCWYAFT